MPSLHNRICEKCGSHYRGEGAKFCSPNCAGNVRKQMRQCKICQKLFFPYSAQAKFCSRNCWYVWQRTHAVYMVDNRVKSTCEICSKGFTMRPYEKRTGRFCSRQCYKVWVARELVVRRINRRARYTVLRLPTEYTRFYNIRCRCLKLRWKVPNRQEFISWFLSEPKLCHYCGIPQEMLERLAVNTTEGYLQVDRMNNQLGYDPSNRVLACGMCNLVKNKYLTYEQMKYVGEHFMRSNWQSKILGNQNSAADAEVSNRRV